MILVIDLEATCADDGSIPPDLMETIEVGAVWATPDGQVVDELQRYVRPALHTALTPFCTRLTSISQADVDAAVGWPSVAIELATFARLHPGSCWGSWGAYDATQIARDCDRHSIDNPLTHLHHVNLKAGFARQRRIRQVGMSTALRIVGLELAGNNHRALDDARNVARLLPFAHQLPPSLG